MTIERHRPPSKAALHKVIHYAVMRGSGAAADPERIAHYYCSLDGRLLACYDPLYGPPDTNLWLRWRPEFATERSDVTGSGTLTGVSTRLERHVPPVGVALVEVINLMATRGDGTAVDPERSVYYYYALNGEMLACFDPIMQNPDFTPPVSPVMHGGNSEEQQDAGTLACSNPSNGNPGFQFGHPVEEKGPGPGWPPSSSAAAPNSAFATFDMGYDVTKCRIELDLASGCAVRVFDTRYAPERRIESWLCRTPAEACFVVECLAMGKEVPRGAHKAEIREAYRRKALCQSVELTV